MFWGDKIVSEIEAAYKEKINSGESLIMRDEKTMSGRVHVGSMRSVALHGTLSQILKEKKIAHRFLYEINDFDVMDGLPVYLDQEKYKPYMGRLLYEVPSPDGVAKNFAEYFGEEFGKVIEDAGYTPEFYRSSDMYKSGKYNEVIRMALLNAPKIREIYKKLSGADKSEDWLPLSVVCENCRKIGTTKATSFDGSLVSYTCGKNYVAWAEGCGHQGKISPFDGNAKLPWKVEWAAKFAVFNVDIEGAGKDHYTKGGAREVANAICHEVFKHAPPFDVPHEFILVGGKKMSSSKGQGSSAKEVSDLLPTQIFRLLLIHKDIKRAIDFIPDGDTIPILYDAYDTYAQKYWEEVTDDDTRGFLLAHTENLSNLLEKRFLPRFSQISFIVQMKHLDMKEEASRIKGEDLTELDIKELEERASYAKRWLESYAPEEYKYEIKKDLPEEAKDFSDIQKEALAEILKFVKETDGLDGQAMHTRLHEIRKELNIEPKDFFSALYISFLGKGSGPKAGWFLSVLDREMLVSRLEEVVK